MDKLLEEVREKVLAAIREEFARARIAMAKQLSESEQAYREEMLASNGLECCIDDGEVTQGKTAPSPPVPFDSDLEAVGTREQHTVISDSNTFAAASSPSVLFGASMGFGFRTLVSDSTELVSRASDLDQDAASKLATTQPGSSVVTAEDKHQMFGSCDEQAHGGGLSCLKMRLDNKGGGRVVGRNTQNIGSFGSPTTCSTEVLNIVDRGIDTTRPRGRRAGVQGSSARHRVHGSEQPRRRALGSEQSCTETTLDMHVHLGSDITSSKFVLDPALTAMASLPELTVLLWPPGPGPGGVRLNASPQLMCEFVKTVVRLRPTFLQGGIPVRPLHVVDKLKEEHRLGICASVLDGNAVMFFVAYNCTNITATSSSVHTVHNDFIYNEVLQPALPYSELKGKRQDVQAEGMVLNFYQQKLPYVALVLWRARIFLSGHNCWVCNPLWPDVMIHKEPWLLFPLHGERDAERPIPWPFIAIDSGHCWKELLWHWKPSWPYLYAAICSLKFRDSEGGLSAFWQPWASAMLWKILLDHASIRPIPWPNFMGSDLGFAQWYFSLPLKHPWSFSWFDGFSSVAASREKLLGFTSVLGQLKEQNFCMLVSAVYMLDWHVDFMCGHGNMILKPPWSLHPRQHLSFLFECEILGAICSPYVIRKSSPKIISWDRSGGWNFIYSIMIVAGSVELVNSWLNGIVVPGIRFVLACCYKGGETIVISVQPISVDSEIESNRKYMWVNSSFGAHRLNTTKAAVEMPISSNSGVLVVSINEMLLEFLVEYLAVLTNFVKEIGCTIISIQKQMLDGMLQVQSQFSAVRQLVSDAVPELVYQGLIDEEAKKGLRLQVAVINLWDPGGVQGLKECIGGVFYTDLPVLGLAALVCTEVVILPCNAIAEIPTNCLTKFLNLVVGNATALLKLLVVSCAEHRLGGKPNLKRRGMSWTGLWAGQWAVGMPEQESREYIKRGSSHEEDIEHSQKEPSSTSSLSSPLFLLLPVIPT